MILQGQMRAIRIPGSEMVGVIRRLTMSPGKETILPILVVDDNELNLMQG